MHDAITRADDISGEDKFTCCSGCLFSICATEEVLQESNANIGFSVTTVLIKVPMQCRPYPCPLVQNQHNMFTVLTHSSPSGRHVIMTFVAKRFPLTYWTSCNILAKALPTSLLGIVFRPWQSASHLPIGHRVTSLPKRLCSVHTNGALMAL